MTPGTAVVLLLTLLAASCTPSSNSRTPLVDEALEGMELRDRVAQLILVPLPADPDPALAELLRMAEGSGLGGVLLRGGSPGPVSHAVRLLQRRSALPLLVAADLDEGVGSLLAGATDFPSSAALAAFTAPADARAAAAHIAAEARAIGINLALVRTPGMSAGEALPLPARDPARAAVGLGAFLDGATDAGLATSIRTLWSVDPGSPPLDWDRARLDAVDLPLLRAAVEAGASVVEMGDARLPSLSGDSLPLPVATAAIQGLLRRDLGWSGVVAVDLSEESALAREFGAGEAAVRCLLAGADLLLGPEQPDSVIAAVVAAVAQGRLPKERVAAAAQRVLSLRARIPVDTLATDSLPGLLRAEEAVRLAERLALRTALRLPGPSGEAVLGSGPVLLATPLGRGNLLASALRAHHGAVRHLPLNLTADSAAVVARLTAEAADGGLLLLADFPSRSGHPTLAAFARQAATDDSSSRSIHLRFQPRSLEPSAGPVPTLVMWGVGPVSQAAAAALLFGLSPADPQPAGLRWPPAPVLVAADPAAAGMDAGALDRVDRVIRQAIDDSVFTGAALAVGRRGGLVRLQGYGRIAPGESMAPVDPERTLFDLASLSKVVGTTTAVALLVDEGRMQLDAALQRYLPEFRGEGKEAVTLRHLLSHTSGIPSGLWLYGSAGSPREALRQVLDQPLRRSPGERVEYSDLGMILLAEAAERAAGMPLDRLLALRVFAPLGMASTMFLPPLAFRDRIVPTAPRSERGLALRGVVHDANAFRLGGVAGHAGLFSTARDVAVFAQMMLNRGSYGTVGVLSAEVAAGFTRRQRGAEERALGWDTPAARSSSGRYFSASSFGHTGFTGTSLWIDPERELFVVLLTNRTYTDASSGKILQVRMEVHDAVARAIRDRPVERRRGAR